MIINGKNFDIRPLEDVLTDTEMMGMMGNVDTATIKNLWQQQYDKYEAEAYKGISKLMQRLAKKYMLDVKVIIAKGNYNSTYKVYKFSGNFLANFEALAREAEKYGWVKSTEYPAALVRA